MKTTVINDYDSIKLDGNMFDMAHITNEINAECDRYVDKQIPQTVLVQGMPIQPKTKQNKKEEPIKQENPVKKQSKTAIKKAEAKKKKNKEPVLNRKKQAEKIIAEKKKLIEEHLKEIKENKKIIDEAKKIINEQKEIIDEENERLEEINAVKREKGTLSAMDLLYKRIKKELLNKKSIDYKYNSKLDKVHLTDLCYLEKGRSAGDEEIGVYKITDTDNITETYNINKFYSGKKRYELKSVPYKKHIVLLDKFLFDKDIDDVLKLKNINSIESSTYLCATDGDEIFFIRYKDIKDGYIKIRNFEYGVWNSDYPDNFMVDDDIISLYDDEKWVDDYIKIITRKNKGLDEEGSEIRDGMVYTAITSFILLCVVGIVAFLRYLYYKKDFTVSSTFSDFIQCKSTGDFSLLLLAFPLLGILVEGYLIWKYRKNEDIISRNTEQIDKMGKKRPDLSEYKSFGKIKDDEDTENTDKSETDEYGLEDIELDYDDEE